MNIKILLYLYMYYPFNLKILSDLMSAKPIKPSDKITIYN